MAPPTLRASAPGGGYCTWGGPFWGAGTPNKYSPYSHGCNPPPHPPTSFWGGNRDTPPTPISGVEPQDPPPLKAPQVLGSDRGPALGLGAHEGKGGRPHPIQPQPTPESQLWAPDTYGKSCREPWGGRGGSPQLDHHPKIQVSESCWLKPPPALEGTGGQHHPCRQGQSGEGSRGWGHTKCGPPSESLRHLPDGQRGREDASGEDGDGLPGGGPEVGQEPFLQGGDVSGGLPNLPPQQPDSGELGNSGQTGGFGVKGDVGKGKFPNRGSAPRGMARFGAQGGVRERSGA